VMDKRLAPAQELARRKGQIEANPPSRHDHEARREPVKIG
jgi:hypothetical protein